MIEPWELILHHTYAGTPGVAFDHSPGRGSHGRAVGLDPSDFVLDGHAAGSGAVRFRPNGHIRVEPSKGFNRLDAFRAEILFRCEDIEADGHLVNAKPHSFFVGFFHGTIDFAFYTKWHLPGGHGWQRFWVRLADYGIDPKSWVKAAVVHDGVGTVQLSLNGEPVKTWRDRPLFPIRGVNLVTIGSESGGSTNFPGLVDDVKIWRPNPTRMTGDFTIRIIKGGVTDCWAKWGKNFRAVLNDVTARDVECAARLNHLLTQVQIGVTSTITHSASTRAAWEQAVAEYQRLWSQGNVDDIGPVMSRLLETLRAEGVPVEQLDACRDLLDDRCFQEILRTTPPLDCDPQFTRMLAGEGN